MGGKTDYYRNKLLDAEFRGQTITFPANWYLALFRGAPGADGLGGTEVAGPWSTTGYQRFALGRDLSVWFPTQGSAGAGAASGGTTGRISNASPITFGLPLVAWSTSGSPITHFALMDAQTGGNMWRIGMLVDSRIVSAGDPAITFLADTLAIYEI